MLTHDPRIDQLRSLLPKAMLADWVRIGSRLVRLLKGRHHAASHDAILERLLEQARASVALRELRMATHPVPTYPSELPITSRKDEIVAAIRQHQVVVIAGETGSGKTTQIPKMCLEAGLGVEAKIGCTQPRRVAALSISRRIADELNLGWGAEIGCKIRFDDRSSPATRIKLMTDGMLLAEAQGDPMLAEYNAIIIDEAHERSLNIDFLLGILRGLIEKRRELKVIITSATIDTTTFSKAFNNAPVIEVSGRVYPVDEAYFPVDINSQECGDITYIDAAVRSAEQVLTESGDGDILIFMPSERDIRESSDLLKGRVGELAEVIPLFGRLTSGEQQRVFAAGPRRRIVIATNIAETSLTIPGIRFVIDSGLARISRYNPRTRTKRLPIEPISQSSANQRRGRCGRVRNGLCIRLYSREDFLSRPPFTQPEIQRANLAEVILRMKAFRLGEIESFPFLNPPIPASIQTGYSLLQELGALDSAKDLTPLGQDLARLPIDPTLGRMLLEAQRQHATRELLIIASGLSIQDPRERPADQKDEATAAHWRFLDPKSDFLTLLNIWNAVHDEWEALRSQSQRRKFCKAHFLSYVRMREWQDLYSQLHEALYDIGSLRLSESNASYDAIHKAILSGLLGHVACREERNQYKAAGNRKVTIFPGSALFQRAPASAAKRARKNEPPPGNCGPTSEWIVAGELVETSQLFARTVAGIDPLWIVQLAPHLCKVTHHNPHWSPEAGRVLAEERLIFNGLEVRRRKVAYGNVAPQEATRIFIRSALVEECFSPASPRRPLDERGSKHSSRALLESVEPEQAQIPPQYSFIDHNRNVRHKVQTWQTRTRRHDLPDLDEALALFYSKHLENVSSLSELNKFLRTQENVQLLHASESDLTGGLDLVFDRQAFPDAVSLEGEQVDLLYTYQPGEEKDGVTLRMGFDLARTVPGALIEWAVPGLRQAHVTELLRNLPKSIRRDLMPLQPKVEDILRDFKPSGNSLSHDLARFIHQRYGIQIPASAWEHNAVPAHLQPRLEILYDQKGSVLSGRDIRRLKASLEVVKAQPLPEVSPDEESEWVRLRRLWERFGLTSWNFDDLPEYINPNPELSDSPLAWPGFELESGQVNLVLFRDKARARRSSLEPYRRLVELALQKDLAWLQKDLKALTRLTDLHQDLCSSEDLLEFATANLLGYILPKELPNRLSRQAFDHDLEVARSRMTGLGIGLIDLLEQILKLRREVQRSLSPDVPDGHSVAKTLSDLKRLSLPGVRTPLPSHEPVSTELSTLLPPDFLREVPLVRLTQFPRYLKALLARAEKRKNNPAKDTERAMLLKPFTGSLAALTAVPLESFEAQALIDEFRWMVEEFKVSVYAQELGTAFPVSPKRLQAQLERIRLATGFPGPVR